jgi:hypothetical protein
VITDVTADRRTARSDAVRDILGTHKVAADTRHDATERRITDLYTKAADQLGSDKAPVRLAGLYALERLAQDNPEHQQTIVNLVCAYLRMPYRPPTLTPGTVTGASQGTAASAAETA